MESNPEIVNTQNVFFKPPQEIRNIHFAIVSELLFQISPDAPIHAPPMECSADNIRAWQYAFADCHTEPFLPLTRKARAIIRDSVLIQNSRDATSMQYNDPSAFSMPADPILNLQESSAPQVAEPQSMQFQAPVQTTVEQLPIQTATMAVPFQFPTNYQSDMYNQYNALTQPSLGVPMQSTQTQGDALTQPSSGVPMQALTTQENNRNTRLIQQIVQIISLQNTLLQDVLATF